ncbi:hypothetical protein EGR_10534 [Echinococcus granulosus]|uniref:Uncharacterized protein n=1 Tax=Echinococcus granulosus TaxID=6210 RepID=W6U0Q5_ECHGR|nr:hypothetical protein EGR_10534 [Echinococcus granulosus]EUB54613.1 hypothetical protein EGR_10534 [Echinococcus granulosus]
MVFTYPILHLYRVWVKAIKFLDHGSKIWQYVEGQKSVSTFLPIATAVAKDCGDLCCPPVQHSVGAHTSNKVVRADAARGGIRATTPSSMFCGNAVIKASGTGSESSGKPSMKFCVYLSNLERQPTLFYILPSNSKIYSMSPFLMFFDCSFTSYAQKVEVTEGCAEDCLELRHLSCPPMGYQPLRRELVARRFAREIWRVVEGNSGYVGTDFITEVQSSINGTLSCPSINAFYACTDITYPHASILLAAPIHGLYVIGDDQCNTMDHKRRHYIEMMYNHHVHKFFL